MYIEKNKILGFLLNYLQDSSILLFLPIVIKNLKLTYSHWDLGRETNNQAELYALYIGLEMIYKLQFPKYSL